MRIIGIITTCFVGAVALVGVLLGIRSMPDFRRYLRMRSM
jgi:hypothetical protein